MDPTGYHVTNLILHFASALLLWKILRHLSIPGAFLAALLFAVHPVNVESVAWIAQRKNSLAMFFFLLSISWYIHADGSLSQIDKARPTDKLSTPASFLRSGRYWLSLFAFALAGLSKGSVAVLPLILLGIIWWQRSRIAHSDLIRILPFFLAAIVLIRVNVWFQTHGADFAFRDVNFAQRLAGAGAVVWFYLSKALMPIHLLAVYPQWEIHAGQLLWWLPLVAAATATIALLWHRFSRWGRPLLFVWGFFCVALLPVLGFIDVAFMQYSLVANHYQHIALIGIVALVAASWIAWDARAPKASRPVSTAAVVFMVVSLMAHHLEAMSTVCRY